MSIRFDVAGDRVSRTTNLPTQAAFTWTGWIYPVVGTTSFAQVSQNQPAAGGGSALVLQVGSANELTVQASGSNSADIATLTNNAWQFVAHRMSGGTHQGWHSLATSTTFSTQSQASALNAQMTLWQCGSLSSDGLFNGRMAAVKIWDVALSDAEVQAEKWSILPRRLAGLNEFYPMFPGATERLAGYAQARNWTTNGTLTDEDPPPVSWGASPIIIGVSAAATYTQTKFRVYLDDGSGAI